MDENFISENKYIISTIFMILITILFYYAGKKEKEDFKNENQVINEKELESVVNKIFGKLNTPFKADSIIPEIKQGSTLFTTKSGINSEDRVGVVHWYHISSGNRDTTKFPNPNSFQYDFDTKLWNVYSVELIRMSIPRGQYTVDEHNNKMDIVTNGSSTTSITIGKGFYDITTYVTQMNTSFSNAGINLIASYVPLTYTITLQNTGGDNYTILYSSGSNSEDSNFNELGFERQDIVVNSGQTVSGTRRVDLFGTCCVDVELKEIDYENGNNTLSNVLINNCALTVYENNCLMSKRHLRPLKNLNKLTIEVSFKAPFKEKRLYNFNGLDYDFTIEVICIEHAPPFLPKLQQFH